MTNYILLACASTALLLASPASANHCDNDMIEVQWLLDGSGNLEPNRVDAAEQLLVRAAQACLQENEQIMSAEPDSPLLEPGYVTLGQSMLINARELLSDRY
jgi:hypothetical protein